MSKTDEIGIISTNTEQEQDQQQQQQLINSLDHNYYVPRGQKAVFTQDRVWTFIFKVIKVILNIQP